MWLRSAEPFHRFAWQMPPVALILMVLLAGLAAAAFSARPIEITASARPPALDRRLLVTSVMLYPLFLVAIDIHRASLGLSLVLALLLLRGRAVLRQVDWPLIAIFVLMFLDLRLVAQQDWARSLVAEARLNEPRRLYVAGIAISQIIGNVPGAILLAGHSDHWHLIACAVNVGGCGSAVGSLANVIALRMLM